MNLRIESVLVVVSILALGRPAYAQQAVPAPNLKDIGFDQRMDAQVPLDLPFRDETGSAIKLGAYFRGKPVVLVLHYARCPMLCPLVFRGIVRGMKGLQQFSIGREFDVLAVSFDPKETPAVAARTKETYVKLYDRPGAAEGWHFLTGNEEAIEELTQAVGFRYVYDAKKDMYVHAAGIIILTPAGKISRYLYGVDFSPRDLRLALVEASANKIGSPTDQVLLYCFHYDPSAGKYTASVMRFIRAGGVLTIVAIASLVWFVAHKRRRKGAGPAAPAGERAAGPAAGSPDAAKGDGA